jgi:DNA-binding NarL/FixJ family response regulator
MRAMAKCRYPKCNALVHTSGYCRPHYIKVSNRQNYVKGGPIGNRLTDEQIAEIRKRSSRFESTREIALAMGISRNTVRHHLKAAQ